MLKATEQDDEEEASMSFPNVPNFPGHDKAGIEAAINGPFFFCVSVAVECTTSEKRRVAAECLSIVIAVPRSPWR